MQFEEKEGNERLTRETKDEDRTRKPSLFSDLTVSGWAKTHHKLEATKPKKCGKENRHIVDVTTH